VEYCKAILSQGAEMKPFPILREGCYHDTTADPDNPSATAVRAMMAQGGNWQDFVPEEVQKVFQNGVLHTKRAGERAMLAKLRTMTEEEFEAVPFGSEGLWRKLMHAARLEATVENIATTTTISCCGGIVGYLPGDSSKNANLSNFTNKGTVTLGGVVGTKAYLGGIAGYFVSKSTGYTNVSNFTNEATATVTMKADFAIAEGATTSDKPTVGGVIGYTSYNHLTNVTNEASVIWAEEGAATSSPAQNELLVGGAIGQHYYGKINTLTNKGAVIFKADNRDHHHHLGGVIGQLGAYGHAVTGLYNSGNITLEATCGTKRCRLGGLVGVLYRSDISECLNTGTISR
jgi:hypothetical protein